MSHLLDTSTFHKIARFPAVRAALAKVLGNSGVVSTCAPVVAEYCFSARSPRELAEMQHDLGAFYLLPAPADELIPHLQTALWGIGFARAANPIDTLIAACAIQANEIVVACDRDYLYFARALQQYGSAHRLRVIHIAEDGALTAA